jgi:hypothetical protein
MPSIKINEEPILHRICVYLPLPNGSSAHLAIQYFPIVPSVGDRIEIGREVYVVEMRSWDFDRAGPDMVASLTVRKI